MITQLNKDSVFSTFDVENFEALEGVIESMAPSMVEYYLSDLCGGQSDSLYFNKKELQNTICIGEYQIYLDYNDNLFLEVQHTQESFETESLW
jgi:hypothetical protein